MNNLNKRRRKQIHFIHRACTHAYPNSEEKRSIKRTENKTKWKEEENQQINMKDNLICELLLFFHFISEIFTLIIENKVNLKELSFVFYVPFMQICITKINQPNDLSIRLRTSAKETEREHWRRKKNLHRTS